jgi:hypothetical protein
VGGIECKGEAVKACLWSSNAASFGYLPASANQSILFGEKGSTSLRDSLGKARLDGRVAEVVLRSRAGLDILPRIIVPERFLVRDLHAFRSQSHECFVRIRERSHRCPPIVAVSAAGPDSTRLLLLRGKALLPARSPTTARPPPRPDGTPLRPPSCVQSRVGSPVDRAETEPAASLSAS